MKSAHHSQRCQVNLHITRKKPTKNITKPTRLVGKKVVANTSTMRRPQTAKAAERGKKGRILRRQAETSPCNGPIDLRRFEQWLFIWSQLADQIATLKRKEKGQPTSMLERKRFFLVSHLLPAIFNDFCIRGPEIGIKL